MRLNINKLVSHYKLRCSMFLQQYSTNGHLEPLFQSQNIYPSLLPPEPVALHPITSR